MQVLGGREFYSTDELVDGQPIIWQGEPGHVGIKAANGDGSVTLVLYLTGYNRTVEIPQARRGDEVWTSQPE